MQREILLFRYWNTLPLALNLKPKLEFQTPLARKLSCWHLGINSFWRQLRYSLEFSRWHLRIEYFWQQLGSFLGLEIPRDSFLGIPRCFSCHLGINSFWRKLVTLFEFFPCQLGINYFWSQLRSPMGLGIPRNSFLEISLCSSLLGFTMLIRWWRTTCFPVGVLLHLSFLGELHQSPKEKITYDPFYPVANYIYIADLNTRLRVG